MTSAVELIANFDVDDALNDNLNQLSGLTKITYVPSNFAGNVFHHTGNVFVESRIQNLARNEITAY